MTSVLGKKPLCLTKLDNFINFVNINESSIYKEYNSFVNILAYLKVDKSYIECFAQPVYDGQGSIVWWTEAGQETPVLYNTLNADEQKRYDAVIGKTLDVYNQAVGQSKNMAYAQIVQLVINTLSNDFAYCFDGKVVYAAWGMSLDKAKPLVKGEIIVPCDPPVIKCRVEFSCENGVLKDRTKKVLYVGNGSIITAEQIPEIVPDEGYDELIWGSPSPLNYKVTSNMEFHATCKQKENVDVVVPDGHRCLFDAGNGGTLKGEKELYVKHGDFIPSSAIPTIECGKNYTFNGWDKSTNNPVFEDTTFHATYKKTPWYKRFWLWLAGLWTSFWAWVKGLGLWGCLWRLLVALLLLFLLFWLLRGCLGCSGVPDGGAALNAADSAWIADDPNVRNGGGIYDPYNPYQPSPTDPAYGDVLPPNEGVLPPSDDVEIIPGNPSIIANRLNVLMENEDKSIMEFAKEFKSKYPDDRYQVVYYDNTVKRMQIQVPKEEREAIKAKLPEQFTPEYTLFVFDEALFEGRYTPTDPAIREKDKNWYMNTVHAYQAWDITRGSEDIVVAVVDNGFNLCHPEIKDKVVMPYNVWSHSDKVKPQAVDHGTHVAGTAVASADNGNGLCGIAPNCKLMPVQVANDNGIMTTTSVLDGVLYSLYQGADVVNISLGSQFTGLSQFPKTVQEDLINNHFKEEERLWNEVMRIAASHNATLVIAAGNDNVLAGIDAMQRPDLFIVVSALDKNNNSLVKTEFSNYGDFSTVSAPGSSIYSCVGNNNYEFMDGTSMAAPVVTGTVALMKSLKPTITTKDIICILKETGVPCNSEVGNLIQIDKALQKVQSGETVDCTPVPSTGDVQILLSWNNYNDLDLICIEPSGEYVWYKNPRSQSNGILEIDKNREYPDSETPIENIYWPAGQAPTGTYNVYLRYFKKHTNIDATPFKVIVKYGDKEDVYSGVIRKADGDFHVCTFVLGEGQNSNSDMSRKDRLEQERTAHQREIDRINKELEQLKNIRR